MITYFEMLRRQRKATIFRKMYEESPDSEEVNKQKEADDLFKKLMNICEENAPKVDHYCVQHTDFREGRHLPNEMSQLHSEMQEIWDYLYPKLREEGIAVWVRESMYSHEFVLDWSGHWTPWFRSTLYRFGIHEDA